MQAENAPARVMAVGAGAAAGDAFLDPHDEGGVVCVHGR
jgi:hypothetical protein